MKHKISALIVAALFSAVPSFSQDLNPQVQVTNDYKAEFGKAAKQSVPLEIPDSLNSFRTSVSYNVFATPYKGSYEFVPYEISVTPQKPASDYSVFSLKAGAGYGLRPMLKAAWTPVHNGNTVTVFNDFHGYAGRYSALDGRDPYSGFDLSEKVGLEGRWVARDFILAYGVDYQGLFNRDFAGDYQFNDFTLRGDIRSDTDSKIVYDFALELNQAYDAQVSQTGVRVKGGFFPNWMLPFTLRMDVDFESDFYGKGPYDNMIVGQVAAKALFDWNPFKLAAGVNFSPASDLQWFYPDVDITADLFDRSLQLYARVKGGQRATSYTGFKLAEHWFNPAYTASLRPTLERLDASLGFRGSAFKHLQYDIHGGWASYSDAPMNFWKVSASDPALMDYGVVFRDYSCWYVEEDIHWKSSTLAVDLAGSYRKTNVNLNDAYLDLPAFCGDLDITYNWNSRIFAGIRAKAVTTRAGKTYSVPGFVDLGLHASYKVNGSFGFWANAGNLLNNDISLSPLHMEKGIYFQGGITLNLR